eukprot:3813609-Ditylum_brightwellii.AAC.1
MEFYMLNVRAYMKIYLGNEGVIQRINKQLEYPHDSKIKINLEHVKRHQDDNTPYEELNLPAHLSTKVDFMVVGYWTTRVVLKEKVI